MKSVVKVGVSVILIVVLITAVELYFRYEDNNPNTEDAYLKASFVKVSSLVSGAVQNVAVRDNTVVQKNQILFSLNPKPFQLETAGAQAKIELIQQKLAAARSAIQAAKQQLHKASIEIKLLTNESERISGLVADGDAPLLDASHIKAKLNMAKAQYKAAQYQLKQTQQELGLDTQKENPELNAAKLALQAAQFKLNHSQYKAPVAGVVSKLHLHQGDVVGAGQPLFVLINTKNYWVEANFTENKLGRIRLGQTAKVQIDMYPNLALKGKVTHIAYSSGSSFSLLPAQNASGNWVKVSQRFPVTVSLTNIPAHKILRVGSSCHVQINTDSYA